MGLSTIKLNLLTEHFVGAKSQNILRNIGARKNTMFIPPKQLATDTIEFTTKKAPVTTPLNAVNSSAKNNIAKTNSKQIENFENISIEDVLASIKKSKLINQDEIDNLETAICYIDDQTPEFKKMVTSIIEQRKKEAAQMVQNGSESGDIVWSLVNLYENNHLNTKSVNKLISTLADDGIDLKKIESLIQNLSSKEFDYLANDFEKLVPILKKLSKSIDVSTKEFLECANCINKNDAKYSNFLYENIPFLKAYNSIGAKLPAEDLKLMMKNYKESGTIEEIEALGLYKMESTKININQLKEQAKTIENYLNKQSIETPIKVFRGETYGFVDSIIIGETTLGNILRQHKNATQEELRNLIANKLSNYKIVQNRFMSTSFDPYLADVKFGKNVVWNLTLPEKTKASCIDMLLPNNSLSNEIEVLVQKNSQLFINDLKFVNNKWYIDATVIQ